MANDAGGHLGRAAAGWPGGVVGVVLARVGHGVDVDLYLAWRGKPYTEIGFQAHLLYRWVRHPIMLGFVVAFWATPMMTAGHLLFAIGATGYILVALQFEERDLLAALGDQYRDYRREVSMLLPWPHRHT